MDFEQFIKRIGPGAVVILAFFISADAMGMIERNDEPKAYVWWIHLNTGPDDIIMSQNINEIAAHSGRSGMATPFEDTATIISFARNMSVDYFFLGEADMRFQDLNLTMIREELNYIASIHDYDVYSFHDEPVQDCFDNGVGISCEEMIS